MKVKLSLDGLKVESFETTPKKESPRGTVRGFDDEATCDGTCVGSCTEYETCMGCATNSTCDYTCGNTCRCGTNEQTPCYCV